VCIAVMRLVAGSTVEEVDNQASLGQIYPTVYAHVQSMTMYYLIKWSHEVQL